MFIILTQSMLTSSQGLTICIACYFIHCPPGPFYVMMAPQGAATTSPRALFPRTGIVKVEPGTRVTRDDRRRATHNEGTVSFVC